MDRSEFLVGKATPLMAAGALFFDEAGHVLLVEPTYKDYLDIPGGYVEQGESPLQACVREVREELGIAPPIGQLLAVDWAPSDGEGDKILYLFDGGVLDQVVLDRVEFRDGEIRAVAFHPVCKVSTVTIPRLARRIEQAVQARQRGETVYLEHGGVPGR
ncbi:MULTISPECIES: NUDIX domain-containing protein [Streptomyces]|uniref:NUDIX hydrolase n=2 Tax=Streptomyces TaxID=1883 RepID=A0ABU2RHL0_9ACTN|nr:MULTISPECIES: NUDIX hydrolase [unclassified Streptomyces]MBK3591337.1 NUDIX hydrolase [Streptomyces sp. MBT51]MDT0428350.1 NUDIX hydrolase [Streptomyces sp. DSM 41770]HBF79312.1 NUDIX hydrolase [Streptomyces sp.]